MWTCTAELAEHEKSLKAVYEQGVLRPLEPLDLPESEEVTVTIIEEPSTEGVGQPEAAIDVRSALADAKRRVETVSD
jgi:predicted DNA-binding antitoxin AbrB/MazE fold protein